MVATKKKIIFFVPVFPVMSETFIEREICELKNRGNLDVKVVALGKGSSLNCDELASSVEYIKLSYKDIFFGLATFITEDPITLWRTRVLTKSNKNRNYLGNMYLWLKSIGYAYLFSKMKFDHIHAHFLSEPSSVALIVTTLLGKPLSISGHARDVFGKTGGGELITEKLRYSKFIALCNKKAYVHCVNLAGTKDKLKSHLLPHGVDVSVATSESKNEVPTILFLGRFVEKKGIVYLIQAVKILKDSGQKFILQLAGYGPLLKEFKNLSDKLGLNDYVTFVNDGKGVNSAQAFDYMGKADIFVMPSIDMSDGDSDGIPNNILEAGIFSKPVITTDAGSILEVITNNETGLVVEQRNPEALADAMRLLLTDTALSQKIGSNLNTFVKENFDIKKNILELEKLLLS